MLSVSQYEQDVTGAEHLTLVPFQEQKFGVWVT